MPKKRRVCGVRGMLVCSWMKDVFDVTQRAGDVPLMFKYEQHITLSARQVLSGFAPKHMRKSVKQILGPSRDNVHLGLQNNVQSDVHFLYEQLQSLSGAAEAIVAYFHNILKQLRLPSRSCQSTLVLHLYWKTAFRQRSSMRRRRL